MADQWQSTEQHAPTAAAAPDWQTTTDHSPASRTWMNEASDYLKGVWSQVNQVEAVKGLATAANDPIGTTSAILHAQDEPRLKAEEAFKNGRYAEGVRHVLGYLVPLIGPAIDQAGNKVQEGKVAEGMGEATGIGLGLAAPEAIRRVPVPEAVASKVGQTAERMYQSALKPPPGSAGQPAAAINKVVKTGVREGIPVSAEGLETVKDRIAGLNTGIQSVIDDLAQRGVTVDPAEVAKRVEQVRPQFKTVNSTDHMAALDKVKQQFLSENPKPIPANEAQAMKQKTYKDLRDQYGKLGTSDTEGQKALARGIKEELASQFPELTALNARESEFIGLDRVLERAVKRVGNRDLVPLASNGWLTMVKKLVEDPEVKSRLAIALDRASKVKSPTLPAAAPRTGSIFSRIEQFTKGDPSAQTGQPATAAAQ